MPITSTDFDELTEELQDIFFEVARRKVGEEVGLDVFNVFDTGLLNYEHQVLHGVSGIEKVDEGQDLPKVKGEEGDNVVYTQNYYGAIVGVTKKMRKFDQHGKIINVVKSITEDAFDKVDKSLADMLANGWSTSYTDVYNESVTSQTPGGYSLFKSSHTTPLSSDTFSNIVTDGTNNNPSLSRDAIRHMRDEVGLTYTDPNGIERPINYDTLLVTPHNRDLANRLLNSEYLPGTANNDRNPLYNELEIRVWPRLNSASDGTDTSEYWFLYDSSAIDESLKCLFAERPALDAPDQVYSNKDWEYSLDFFYATGLGFPAYIAGSKGTN